MNTQNMMLNFMAKLPVNPSEPVSMEKNNYDSFSQFKAVLDKAVNQTPSNNTPQKSMNRVIKRNENTSNEIEPDRKFTSFRDAQNNTVKAKDTSEGTSDTKTETANSQTITNSSNDKDDDVKVKGNAAVDSLAAILGIQPQELMKLMDAMGIKQEDLIDSNKTGEIVNKLSDLMGLNAGQKQALTEIFATVAKECAAVQVKTDNIPTATVSKQENSQAKDDNSLVKLDIKEAAIENKSDASGDLKGILAKLKSQVEMLTQKLQQNPPKALEEIKATVDKTIGEAKPGAEVKQAATEEAPGLKTDNQLQNNTSDNKNEQTDGEKAGSGQVNAQQDDDKSEKRIDLKTESHAGSAHDKTDHGTRVEAAKVGGNVDVKCGDVQINQIQKTDTADGIFKVQAEKPVPKSEIINQVIEKAKVTLSGEKSEMIMDLKPDNLGKLALKVVTERGLVVAKFVAESQQVKEVLESNMQLLKDSLEKQGLSVQGFSVSVQQDSSKGFNRFNETSEKNGKSGSKLDAMGGKMVNVADIPDIQQKNNPYMWSESRINLTA